LWFNREQYQLDIIHGFQDSVPLTEAPTMFDIWICAVASKLFVQATEHIFY
jgi:hypothetical protein